MHLEYKDIHNIVLLNWKIYLKFAGIEDYINTWPLFKIILLIRVEVDLRLTLNLVNQTRDSHKDSGRSANFFLSYIKSDIMIQYDLYYLSKLV